MGVKTPQMGYYVLNYLKRKLSLTFVNIEVSNIMAHIKLNKTNEIEKFFEENRSQSMYDPKLFPGLIYTHDSFENKKASLFKKDGKINLYGCKSFNEVKVFANCLIDKLN